ncbi:MAG: Rab family GTPase [Candidatus Hermodarchaeota archaeon]
MIVQSQPNYLFKIINLGSVGVGKSSLFRKFVYGTFEQSYISLLGVDIETTKIHVKDVVVKLILFDTAGQEYFAKLRPTYYKGARAALVVFDVTNEKTFKDAKAWWKELLAHLPEKIPGILIGNKIDLMESRTVTSEKGKTLAKELNLPYIETSAKTGKNVEQSLYTLVSMMLVEDCFPLPKVLCPYCGSMPYFFKRDQLCFNCNNRIE